MEDRKFHTLMVKVFIYGFIFIVLALGVLKFLAVYCPEGCK